jgi:hypothetical protein
VLKLGPHCNSLAARWLLARLLPQLSVGLKKRNFKQFLGHSIPKRHGSITGRILSLWTGLDVRNAGANRSYGICRVRSTDAGGSTKPVAKPMRNSGMMALCDLLQAFQNHYKFLEQFGAAPSSTSPFSLLSAHPASPPEL